MKIRNLVVIAMLLFVVTASFSADSFAEKRLLAYTVPGVRNEYVLNYEFVSSDDGKILLRTKVAQFTALNNGSEKFGIMVAKIALNAELMKFVVKARVKVYGDTTEISRSAMVSNGATIDGDYAVINLDEVKIAGVEFTSGDLVNMCE
jgi:hypothetical protein